MATVYLRQVSMPHRIYDRLRSPRRTAELIRKNILATLLKWRTGYWRREGIDVMSEDWDNLIILDACRYDFFSDINNIDGELKKANSKASSSWEFMKKHFVGEKHHDTVYVTANPFFEQLDDNTFYSIHTSLTCSSDKFDHHHAPDMLYKKAVECNKKYPNKRLLVHFMQPHQPYLGPTGDEIHAEFEAAEKDDYRNIMHYIGEELDSTDKLKIAYRENLEIVLNYVQGLINEIDGKTIITADHGEGLGENYLGKRFYGHGAEMIVPQLREVPWLIIHSENRRTIRSEAPKHHDSMSEREFNQQLEALGYK